jgi:very-short-patch-repair endonuclease
MILPGTGRGTGEAGGGGSPPSRRPEILVARKLRKEMSLPEVALWQRLRGGRVGPKFRRQHPVGPYVVDFYCREAALIVEVDGKAHDNPLRAARDDARHAFLKENGFRVIHVAAADILRDADSVAASIAALVARPLHRPADGPPPRAGEDIQ